MNCSVVASADTKGNVDVYELSVSCPPYLGLDQTDAGRKGHTVKEATLVTDPKCEGLKDDAVTWTACGELCEFKDENGVAKSKGEKVKYRNKGPDKASGAIRAEPLTAKVSIPGAEDVYCTTNFTVVKVDVKIGDMDENREEAKGRAVMFSKPNRDRASGELIWSTVKSYPVKFVVKPDSLPGDERFRLESNDFPGRAKMLRCGTKNAEEVYKLSELRSNSFSIVLPYRSTEWNDRWVMLTHLNSGARDKACMTCCDIELVSPSGDPVSAPGETNEFTYDDESKTLTVPFRAQIVPKPKASVSGLTGTFTAGDIPGVACTWKTPSGGKIGDGLSASVKIESDWSFRASAVFDGYPEHNDSFGRKKAKFELKSKHKSYALENDYEVFFPKKGKNHPECKNCPGCPNWFYYWKEGQACKIPDYAYYAGAMADTYGATSISMLMAAEKAEKLGFAEAGKVLDLNHVIAIYDLAAEEEQEFKIPTPSWATGSLAKKYAGFTVGGLRGGLACCAAIVAHEMHHVDMWKEFHGKPDRDKDGVADESEETYDGIATRVDKSDTYNVSGKIDSSYFEEGDNEVRARIVERTGPSYDAAKDWANPGFQCKDHSESYDKVKEYGK